MIQLIRDELQAINTSSATQSTIKKLELLYRSIPVELMHLALFSLNDGGAPNATFDDVGDDSDDASIVDKDSDDDVSIGDDDNDDDSVIDGNEVSDNPQIIISNDVYLNADMATLSNVHIGQLMRYQPELGMGYVLKRIHSAQSVGLPFDFMASIDAQQFAALATNVLNVSNYVQCLLRCPMFNSRRLLINLWRLMMGGDFKSYYCIVIMN